MIEQPGLVLLDVMMPDMSGWEVCRQIRHSSTVPVIMLTAKAADGDVVTGLTAGADDYIAKPYSLNQLLARVEAVLRRGRRVPTPVVRGGGGVDRTADAPRPREETAYHGQASLAPTLPRPSVAIEPEPTPETERTGLGQRLADARRMRGMTLYQAEMACGIRWEFLQALEYEHFTYIPRPQLRQVVRNYSMYLGVDLRDFVKRPAEAGPPVPTVSTDNSLRAAIVGGIIAVLALAALIVLVILGLLML
jgi:transcriptional regulator with XRE-family HTH domain